MRNPFGALGPILPVKEHSTAVSGRVPSEDVHLPVGKAGQPRTAGMR